MGLVDLLIKVSGKCQLSGKCPIYDSKSTTCNKTGGMYYQGRPAGCYRRLKKIEQEKPNEGS